MKINDVLMDEVKEGEGAGAEGKEAAKPVEKPEEKSDAGKASLLSKGSDKDAPKDGEYTIDPASGRPSIIPEKYWDPEKKALRVDDKGVPIGLAKGYADLEKRMGAGGMAPAKPEDYKAEAALKVVKEKLAIDAKLDPEQSKAFAKEAHEQGLSQKQYEWLITKYFEQIPALAGHVFANAYDEGQKELATVWPAEADLKKNVAGAYRAFMAYAPEQYRTQEAMNKVGNNPLVIQILAAVAKDMGEDAKLNIETNLLASDGLEQLMRGGPGKPDSPYWNPDDPQHKRVKAQVAAHHEAMEKARKLKAA